MSPGPAIKLPPVFRTASRSFQRSAAQTGKWGAESVAGSLLRLDEFNKRLLAASPLVAISEEITEAMCAAIGMRRAAYFSAAARRAGSSGATLAWGFKGDRGHAQLASLSGSGLIERALHLREPLLTQSARAAGLLGAELIAPAAIGPLLCVPIIGGAAPVGLVIFDNAGSPFAAGGALLHVARAAGESLGRALDAAGSQISRPLSDANVALTGRQMEILALLARGHSNKQIAIDAGISSLTVRDHVSNLFERLGVNSRSAAVHRGAQLGLI